MWKAFSSLDSFSDHSQPAVGRAELLDAASDVLLVFLEQRFLFSEIDFCGNRPLRKIAGLDHLGSV